MATFGRFELNSLSPDGQIDRLFLAICSSLPSADRLDSNPARAARAVILAMPLALAIWTAIYFVLIAV